MGTNQVKWTKRRRHPFSTTSTFPFERNPFLTRPFLPFYPSSYWKRQNHIDEQFPLLLFFRFWFCAVAVYRFCCVVLYVFFSNPLPQIRTKCVLLLCDNVCIFAKRIIITYFSDVFVLFPLSRSVYFAMIYHNQLFTIIWCIFCIIPLWSYPNSMGELGNLQSDKYCFW